MKYDILEPYKEFLYDQLTANTARKYYSCMVKFLQGVEIYRVEDLSLEYLQIELPQRFRTKNELSALYSVDKCVPKGYCNSNSSAKCNEQEMTYPYHRLQKAVGCARRQQGAVWPSPASSLGESGQNRPPCRSSREPAVNGVRSPAQCGVGLRVSGRH